MPIEKRWLKVSEVGEYLGLHPKSVYRACWQRKIPFSKASGIGIRIDKQEIDALLEREGINALGFGRALKAKKSKS